MPVSLEDLEAYLEQIPKERLTTDSRELAHILFENSLNSMLTGVNLVQSLVRLLQATEKPAKMWFYFRGYRYEDLPLDGTALNYCYEVPHAIVSSLSDELFGESLDSIYSGVDNMSELVSKVIKLKEPSKVVEFIKLIAASLAFKQDDLRTNPTKYVENTNFLLLERFGPDNIQMVLRNEADALVHIIETYSSERLTHS